MRVFSMTLNVHRRMQHYAFLTTHAGYEPDAPPVKCLPECVQPIGLPTRAVPIVPNVFSNHEVPYDPCRHEFTRP
jgi:hypothetical protein